MSLPKVTFGFVNCNRLLYLKSNLESLLKCTEDYTNKEIIVVDNCSKEEGTEEYLQSLKDRGFTVIQRKERDPKNEFAKAKNLIVRESSGDFICPLTGDMQFVLKGKWLEAYVEFFSKNESDTGCIGFDAQRTIRNKSSNITPVIQTSIGLGFTFNMSKAPIAGAANCMFSRKNIELLYPWSEKNEKHEGGGDSETKMLAKCRLVMEQQELRWKQAQPIIPPSIAIYNEDGSNGARINGEERIGDYIAPREDTFRYYELKDYNYLVEAFGARDIPIGIEEIATPVGWKAPIDKNGNWMKNPPKIDR